MNIVTLILGLNLVGVTPDSLFKMMEERLKGINDYTCTLTSYEREDSKEQYRVYEYRYMSPGWVWMKIIDGDNKGAVVAYNPNTGKVRAHKGGILSVIKISTTPDNNRVKSMRGHRIDHSHFPAVLDRMVNASKEAESTVVETLSTSWVVHIQNIANPEKFLGASTLIMTVDKTSLLPVKVEEFDANQNLVKRVEYKDIKVNVGLTTKDFNL